MLTIKEERSQIEKLPPKVLSQILSYFHPKQLRVCASINRFFYEKVVSMETNPCIVLKTIQDVSDVILDKLESCEFRMFLVDQHVQYCKNFQNHSKHQSGIYKLC